MGGVGSGEWCRLGTKMTVEECLNFSVSAIKDDLYHGGSGGLRWGRHRKKLLKMLYFVSADEERLKLVLNYHRRGKTIWMPVGLEDTTTNFGGKRWWFTCPLQRFGLPCNRRCGKLYLPRGARYFGCRKCYDLTYRSSQEAHKFDRTPKWLSSLTMKSLF